MAAPPPANIKFEDDIHKLRSAAASDSTNFAADGRDHQARDRVGLAGAVTSGSSVPAGGIYHARSRSRGPVGGDAITLTRRRRSLSRRGSTERRGTDLDVEEGEDWQRDDFRKKQVFRGKTLLWLAYQSIGVIYGDIGTSPLYVYSSTFTSEPSPNDITEVLSIIIWALTLMVTVKYVFVILNADNEGEGGTFSCYSLLTRFANISDRDPRENQTVRIERYLTGDVRPATRAVRKTLEGSIFFRGLLKTIGILAVSMVMADGVLTPAQSVLGAVQGLNVVKPDITNATVVGTSCGILILLFLIQPFGTTLLATGFAPIVILWLGFNGAFGIYNLVKFDHSVLKAFSPVFAFRFMIERKTEGWHMLGGILLAFTGVEALFADLGAFSMRAIQLSWLCWAYPCLLLAYIGQAAYMSVHPEAWSNPFFNSVPPGMLYPSLIVAVLAAIVASQAIITATFQLTSQIMKLSYCPQVKIVHTSKVFHGQLYVPFLNWLLMIGTVLVTAIYNNTTSLGAAYGVCVMFVTFFDTCMVTLVALIVWKVPIWVVFLPWLAQSCLDGLFLTSALNKVPDGAWFTLTLACVLALLFLLWRYGKETQWHAEAEDRFHPSALVRRDAEDGKVHMTERWGGDALSPLRAVGIYFDKTGVLTPPVFTQFVAKMGALPDVVIFFHLHPVETPTVASDERFVVSRFQSIPGTYRLVARHGFMDEIISPDLGALIYEQIRKFIIRQAAARRPELERRTTTVSRNDVVSGEQQDENATTPEEAVVKVETNTAQEPVELMDEVVREELARLDRAYAAKVLYVVGKEQMKVKKTHALWRRGVLSTFLWIRDNTRAKVQNLRLAMDRVVEVGFVKDI